METNNYKLCELNSSPIELYPVSKSKGRKKDTDLIIFESSLDYQNLIEVGYEQDSDNPKRTTKSVNSCIISETDLTTPKQKSEGRCNELRHC